MMSREQQGMMQRVLHGVAFNKWFGSDRDAPDGGGGDALVFSHGSMSYVRGCCAALEGLTPAGDAGVVTIVKKMLDAGVVDVCLPDLCLPSSLSLGNCVLVVLKAACRSISKCVHIFPRCIFVTLCACTLSPASRRSLHAPPCPLKSLRTC